MAYIAAVTTATGEFVYGGWEPYDCVPGLSPTQSRVVCPRAPLPRTERWDFGVQAIVAKTAQEITAYDAALKLAAFTATSEDKDVLTFCALSVRSRGIAAWNAMTLPQKKEATLAEAAVWVNIRDFIESNL